MPRRSQRAKDTAWTRACVGRAAVRIRQSQDALNENDRGHAAMRLQQAIDAILNISEQAEEEAAAEGWIEIASDARDPDTRRVLLKLCARLRRQPEKV